MGPIQRLVGTCLAWAATAAALAQVAQPLPTSGPAAQPGKVVAFIASDFRNGGVMGVYRGLEEAARTLGWKLTLEDGKGEPATQAQLLQAAIRAGAQGVVFGGFDPKDFAAVVASARQARTVLVGWHAAKDPGPTADLFVNVSTHATDVARIAAEYVIHHARAAKQPLGVVLFNDNQFDVANAKTAAMQKTIEACPGYTGCKVLVVENVKISDAAQAIPAVVPKLLAAHGAAWTYTLAINDVYFDAINFPLLQAKRTDIRNVSAGDGSSKALGRISAGVSQQIATVAEPLKLHGYQLADELNRAFAGAPPSGFQSQPILVTAEVLRVTGTPGLDSSLGFEATYAALWKRRSP